MYYVQTNIKDCLLPTFLRTAVRNGDFLFDRYKNKLYKSWTFYFKYIWFLHILYFYLFIPIIIIINDVNAHK